MVDFEALGRYKIVRQIGQGGMGLVLLGQDPKIDRLVALKVIYHKNFADPEHMEDSIKRFHQEAKAAGKLNHPNIVTVYDVGEQEDVSFIAMEFVEGKDLAHVISENDYLPYKEATQIIIQVAEALSYSHENGIIHRDIKPGNIMIQSSGAVKITDFGLARLQEAESITRSGHTVGSPLYMSPEQIQSGDLDHRSDIFSMGVVYFEMLTGLRPFEGENLTELIEAIMENDPASASSIMPEIPPGVDVILRKMMAKEPKHRYQTAGSAARELQNLLTVPDPFQGMTESDIHRTTNYPGTMTPVKPFLRKKPKKSLLSNPFLAVLVGLVMGIFGILFFGDMSESLKPARQAMLGVFGMASPPPDTPKPPPVKKPEPPVEKPPSEQPPPEPPPPAEPPPQGMLSLKANAPATLFVDGVEAGSLPLEGYGLAAGSRQLKVAAEGYSPWTQAVEAKGGESLDFDINLELAPGTLRITSEPTGAKVILNGESRGVTPYIAAGLEPGELGLRLELIGYAPWTGQATLEEGKSLDLQAALKKPALLIIKALPQTKIMVDGRLAGIGGAEMRLSEGIHEVVASLKGHKGMLEMVEGRPGAVIEMDMNLQPLGYGSVKVTAAPWAEIYINGKNHGTTPKTIKKVNAGEAKITLVNPGFQPFETTATVRRDQLTKIHHEFKAGDDDEKESAKTGVLTIISRDESEVYINGEKKGKTPLSIKDMPVGGHQVTLKRNGATAYSQKVNITEGSETRLNID